MGGCLTVENPYAARMRVKKLMKRPARLRNRFTFTGPDRDIVKFDQGSSTCRFLSWTRSGRCHGEADAH